MLFFALSMASMTIRPAGATSASNSAICIEYIGESTGGPVQIVISDSRLGGERGEKEFFESTGLPMGMARVFIVDPSVMGELLAEYAKFPNKAVNLVQEQLRGHPIMLFQVVTLTPSGKDLKMLDGPHTYALLERFKNHCEKGALLEDLVRLQRWMEW